MCMCVCVVPIFMCMCTCSCLLCELVYLCVCTCLPASFVTFCVVHVVEGVMDYRAIVCFVMKTLNSTDVLGGTCPHGK